MIKKLKQFIDDVQVEMKKVSWPTWEELKGSTYVVLSLSLVLAIFLFFVDFVLGKVLSFIL
ncbi:MAG: preprotein translocase subunit SecE [Candidatus Marinimicrobia bacterium]|jgi:preprotein translocase subunit SecE|nr:preprotein translocase subunit SecE [Candidatus Neomarinimicrobiota bacterium]MBT3495963.1 preprotein translocase subunit SecE [Candidatus Neomarinimicrobiota bacterium]MBT3692742.1 preprotein translocase subunit SecE [Candidatus Neomarinimicrobiota bacterium]MBT3732320.1 preprotein translocase subunit SecE [Candidatus Neomarinimicrobiota bacterium]MBT4144365.1 preprotein translocase subunit SecE [Candidatus Neomarinimicrobiota bacterium]